MVGGALEFVAFEVLIAALILRFGQSMSPPLVAAAGRRRWSPPLVALVATVFSRMMAGILAFVGLLRLITRSDPL